MIRRRKEKKTNQRREVQLNVVKDDKNVIVKERPKSL